jgi:hypothetical protein
MVSASAQAEKTQNESDDNDQADDVDDGVHDKAPFVLNASS